MTQYCQDYVLAFNIYMIGSYFLGSLNTHKSGLFPPGGARPYQDSKTEGYWQITLTEGIKPVVPDTEITYNRGSGGEEKGGTTNTQLPQPPQIALLLE